MLEIEEAYSTYRQRMEHAMTSFSRDEQLAQDAVSHAFEQALGNRFELEQMPTGAMRAWLYATARNAIIDAKRREKRACTLPEDMLCQKAWDPTDEILAKELISRLPKYLYTPVYLKYYCNMNASEIGDRIHIPAATVRTRIRTALRKMRLFMEE